GVDAAGFGGLTPAGGAAAAGAGVDVGMTLIRHWRVVAAPRLLATTARTTIVPGSIGCSVRLSCLPAGVPSPGQASRRRSSGGAAFAVSPGRIPSPAAAPTPA